MKKHLLLALALALAGCREEAMDAPPPVAMTAESVGYFCQMHLLEHSGPKGQAALEGLDGQPLYFSQVRDTIAYLRMPEQSHKILALYVSDMGKAKSWDEPGVDNWIALDKAELVIGSDAEGGMGGAEIVPFGTRAAADAFAAEHGGRVVTLADVPDSAVFADDSAPADDAEDPAYQDRLKALSDKIGD